MNFRQLTVLLPCHGLEDFPLYHEGPAADELLVAWCALWHPALLHAAGRLPDWQRIDFPPEDLENRLLTLPAFCLDRLPAGFTARVATAGAPLVSEPTVEAAWDKFFAAFPAQREGISPSLADDFVALGFCRLQIELLTRQMRYMVNIDETHFQNEALSAAAAAVEHDEAKAREHLGHCFDTLYEARKHFYPVDLYLLDITLAVPSTLEGLADELAGGTPLNLLATPVVLQQLADSHPDTWKLLLKAIDHGRACAVGGEDEELELPLLPIEAAVRSLTTGAKHYEALLGRTPVVYGRRRAGLWTALPQLLAKLAYTGALHFTLDDGKFPLGPQCKVRWEGLETSVVDIFARVPSDAAKSETFLGLSRTIADSMDTDHVATVAFAHWPRATSRWYGVLRRIAELSPVLGKFILLDDYFMHTDMPGRLSKFEADDYRTPYLKQAIIRREADPISRFVRAHRDEAERTAQSALATVCNLIAGPADNPESQSLGGEMQRFVGLLPRDVGATTERAVVFNSSAVTRRMNVNVSRLSAPPAVGGAVLAGGATGNRKFAVVEVPSHGFAWLESSAAAAAAATDSVVAGENVLRNEFLEVKVSTKTGGIQSLYNFGQRGNQLSQQIAFRAAAAGLDQSYSTMQAETVEITASTSAYGEITSRGVLVDAAGQPLGRFRQTTGVWAGSRLVEIDIELSDLAEPRADPWQSYYAVRFAWPDDKAELWRGVSSARQRTIASRIEAPEFIDIDNGASTISLLTGGLPYHRKSDPRMLDTLLVVRGETARTFKLAIGVDLAHPAAASSEWLAPSLVQVETGPPPKNTSGWFFHVGGKNIVATHWEPIFDEFNTTEDGTTAPRVAKGFRARLLEISGQAGRVPLRAFQPISYARQVDFLGETILELYVDDDKIMLDFGPHELLEVEAHWIR